MRWRRWVNVDYLLVSGSEYGLIYNKSIIDMLRSI